MFSFKNLFSFLKKVDKEKVKLLAQIRLCINFCDNIINHLDKIRYPKEDLLINKIEGSITTFKSLLKSTYNHLEEAESYLKYDNINNAVSELKNANKTINSEYLSKSLLKLLVDNNLLNKQHVKDIGIIKSNIAATLNTLLKSKK